MALTPFTHHQILNVVEPFTRRGRHVDLAASDRLARRLAFRPLPHPALQATEVLQLENPGVDRWRLTRVLTLEGPQAGLQARLVAEGPEPGELLARIDAVRPDVHLSRGPGWVLAKSHKLMLRSGTPRPAEPLILTDASARLDGLLLRLRVSPVKGIAGEIELETLADERGPDRAPAQANMLAHDSMLVQDSMPAQASMLVQDSMLVLPDDLLAVLGWDWARLVATGAGWRTRLRLRGGGEARGADAEAKLERAVRHLAKTLAQPPAAFHDTQRGARWRVVVQRSLPLLGALLFVAGAALVARLDLPQESLLRMLIFHSPPILLMLFFCLNELPRVEIPPLPRRPSAASWRVPRTQLAGAPARP